MNINKSLKVAHDETDGCLADSPVILSQAVRRLSITTITTLTPTVNLVTGSKTNDANTNQPSIRQ